jgi:hypothetical protein
VLREYFRKYSRNLFEFAWIKPCNLSTIIEMQTPTVFDFNNTAVDKLVYEMKKSSEYNGITRFYGPVMYENRHFRTRTPYMRTPRGLVESEFGNKKEFHFELSLSPTDLFNNCLPTNSSNIEKFKNFVTAIEQGQRLHISENFDSLKELPENYSYSGMPFSPDVFMDKWQKSIIKESTDGFPPKVNFRFTKEIKKGELEGALVLEQKFDYENKKFVFKTENGKTTVDVDMSSISKIGKHAQVRIQAALYSYFTFDINEPEKSNFGLKWVPEQIVFINNPHFQTKETLFTSCNFNDIVPQDEIKQHDINPKLTVMEEAEEPAELDGQPDMKRIKCE